MMDFAVSAEYDVKIKQKEKNKYLDPPPQSIEHGSICELEELEIGEREETIQITILLNNNYYNNKVDGYTLYSFGQWPGNRHYCSSGEGID